MPWQVKRETMDKRKKLYILVWINGTFSLIFERGALHFHFCVSPCKLGSWPCLPSSAYCLPHPSSHKSYPVKVRSLSKLQTSSLYQRQEKSERVGDSELFFYSHCLSQKFKSLSRSVQPTLGPMDTFGCKKEWDSKHLEKSHPSQCLAKNTV